MEELNINTVKFILPSSVISTSLNTELAAKDESEQFYILCLDHQFVQFKVLDSGYIHYQLSIRK